jgi:predicted dehydrogenase
MPDGQPLGVGVIGLSATGGWAARSHVPALRHVDGVELVACSASSADTALAAAQAYGVQRAHPDAESLVRDPAVDVVLVTVKVPDHRAAVLTALRAGKHVYCEWPLGRSTAEAELLLEEATAAGRLTFVGLQARSSPAIELVHNELAGGGIGAVLDTVVTGHGLVGTPIQTSRSCYQLEPRNGAHLGTIALAHVVDVIGHVIGPWDSLVGVTRTAHPRVRLKDTGRETESSSPDHVAVVGSAGGALATIHLRPGVPEFGLPGMSWEVRGTRGALVVRGDLALPQMTRMSIEVHDESGSRSISWEDLTGGLRTSDPAVVPLLGVWRQVADAVRTGVSTLPDFGEGLLLHRLVDLARAGAQPAS